MNLVPGTANREEVEESEENLVRPGQVSSDQQAFQQVLGRLESDVGTILQLVGQSKNVGYFPNTAPLWALVRMTIPIAESTGDLIYRNRSTVQNLISVLENDFEAVRPGAYKGKANILALLFRHSLTTRMSFAAS